jgi:hypothetical protein
VEGVSPDSIFPVATTFLPRNDERCYKNTIFAHVARRILFPGDPSQQVVCKMSFVPFVFFLLLYPFYYLHVGPMCKVIFNLQPSKLSTAGRWLLEGTTARRTSLCCAHARGGAGVRASGHRAPPAAAVGVGARAPPLPGSGGGEEKRLLAARRASLCRAQDRGGGASVWAAGHRAPPAAAAGMGARALPLPGPGGGAPVAVRRTIRR